MSQQQVIGTDSETVARVYGPPPGPGPASIPAPPSGRGAAGPAGGQPPTSPPQSREHWQSRGAGHRIGDRGLLTRSPASLAQALSQSVSAGH